MSTPLFEVLGMKPGVVKGVPVLLRVPIGQRADLAEAHDMARRYSATGIVCYLIGLHLQISVYQQGELLWGEPPPKATLPCGEIATPYIESQSDSQVYTPPPTI